MDRLFLRIVSSNRGFTGFMVPIAASIGSPPNPMVGAGRFGRDIERHDMFAALRWRNDAMREGEAIDVSRVDHVLGKGGFVLMSAKFTRLKSVVLVVTAGIGVAVVAIHRHIEPSAPDP